MTPPHAAARPQADLGNPTHIAVSAGLPDAIKGDAASGYPLTTGDMP